MPLSTKKTTPGIDYGKNNIDPLPEPPEEKQKGKGQILQANEFLSLFEKAKDQEKDA